MFDKHPISVEKLTHMAHSDNTIPSYADYLRSLLTRAQKTVNSFNGKLEDIKFEIDPVTGDVHPFGEGGYNPQNYTSCR